MCMLTSTLLTGYGYGRAVGGDVLGEFVDLAGREIVLLMVVEGKSHVRVHLWETCLPLLIVTKINTKSRKYQFDGPGLE